MRMAAKNTALTAMRTAKPSSTSERGVTALAFSAVGAGVGFGWYLEREADVIWRQQQRRQAWLVHAPRRRRKGVDDTGDIGRSSIDIPAGPEHGLGGLGRVEDGDPAPAHTSEITPLLCSHVLRR